MKPKSYNVADYPPTRAELIAAGIGIVIGWSAAAFIACVVPS